MPVIVKWYGHQIQGQITADSGKALDEAGKAYVASLQQVVGVPGFGVHSRPGNPPLLQTGDLKASFQPHATRDTLTVTSDKVYAKYLEDGTSKMARRPFRDLAMNRMIVPSSPPPEMSKSPGIRSVWRNLLSAVVRVFKGK